MNTGICRLCQEEADLKHSHILPAFVFRWLKESSGNGHIRNSAEPNKRVQDGLKRYWLCNNCEELFSGSETAFANRLFHPHILNPGQIRQYSTWLLHFCTSISWRLLRFYKDEGHLDDWSPEAIARVVQAEIVWREYLLGKRNHPGAHQQHLLPFDFISSTNGGWAPNINRYLTRAIDMDICRGFESIFTYAKLGRFMIIGFVHEPNNAHWKGTKVCGTRGIIKPSTYVLPGGLKSYLNERATKVRAAMTGMSEKQYVKVDEAFRGNIDRYSKSDAFIAMKADVEMFGSKAFSRRDKG